MKIWISGKNSSESDSFSGFSFLVSVAFWRVAKTQGCYYNRANVENAILNKFDVSWKRVTISRHSFWVTFIHDANLLWMCGHKWRRKYDFTSITDEHNACSRFWAYNCSDPLEGGGTIYSNGFSFVPWIFAARYINRRELRLVSLESSSSVEYGIKKIFLIFVFYRELSRFKLLRKEEWIHVVFIHIFRNFCLNFRQFC